MSLSIICRQSDFYCQKIDVVDGFLKSVFENDDIQHYYGWYISAENEIEIKAFCNNRICQNMNGFDSWIQVFSHFMNDGDRDNRLRFKSLLEYNIFVDEVFRLMYLYKKYILFDI